MTGEINMPEQTTYWVVPVIRQIAMLDYPHAKTELANGASGVLFVYPTREAAIMDNPGHEHLIMEFETIGDATDA